MTQPYISFETLTRAEVGSLLMKVIADDALVHAQIGIAKGSTLTGALALHFAAASAEARRVIGLALSDMLPLCLDVFRQDMQGAGRSHLLRYLDILELALEAHFPVLEETIAVGLSGLSKSEDSEIAEATACALSYLSNDSSILAVDKLQRRASSNATIASFAIEQGIRINPLASLDLSFGRLVESSFALGSDLSLSVDAALSAMFRDDPRLASAKLAKVSSNWPLPLVQLVVALLRSTLSSDVWARDLIEHIETKILRKRVPREAMKARGIAHRILTTKCIRALKGYSLSAAREPKLFHPFVDLWMEAIVTEALRILVSKYGFRYGITSHNQIEVNWIDWPDQIWYDTFTRVLVKRTINPVEVCFEVVYMDDYRSGVFRIVELARLKTLSVLYHDNNAFIGDYLEAAGKSCSISTALSDWNSASRQDRQTIHVPMFNVAGDLTMQLLEGSWSADRRAYYSKPEQLLAEVRGNPRNVVAICDNVVANDLLARASAISQPLRAARLSYPTPIPIGLVYDATDRMWGDILNEALNVVLVDGDSLIMESLEKLVGDLEAIDAPPSSVLRRLRRGGAASPVPQDQRGVL